MSEEFDKWFKSFPDAEWEDVTVEQAFEAGLAAGKKRIDDLEQALGNHPEMKCPPGAHGPEPMEPCEVCSWTDYVRSLFKKTVEKILPKPVEPIEHAEGCEGVHCSRCGYCEITADGYNPCICYAR